MPEAVPDVRIDPIRAGPPGAADLAPVAFLAGCWRSVGADGVITEERWTLPAGGIALGSSRSWRGSDLLSFEHLLIRAGDEGVVYLPSPAGRPSPAVFRLVETGPGLAVFSAPEHDYPRRIAYRQPGQRTLEIVVDGGPDDPDPLRWIHDGVACDG